jgi:Tfp pilus assembly protein PilZ
VQVVGSKTAEQYVTADISRGGVFVKTDMPKSVRHLLRLKIAYADGVDPLEVHGMVVHTTTPADAVSTGETPGMGIEFIAFGGAPRERWESYVRSLVQAQTSQVARSSGTYTAAEVFGGQPTAAAPVNRSAVPQRGSPSQMRFNPQQQQQQRPSQQIKLQSPPQQQRPSQMQYQPPQQQGGWPQQYQPPQQRPSQMQYQPQQQQQQPAEPRKKIVQVVFPIPVRSVDQLYEIYERELVAGKMFVCTPEQLNSGDRVALRIIHPVSQQEYDLYGKVERVHTDPQYPGLIVNLRPSTVARREKFRSFIEEGLPEEELPTDLVEE